MKILVLNGSPRLDGNTRTALNAITKGINESCTEALIEIYDISEHKLSCCINCDGCKSNGGNCVLPDETADIINKMYEADGIIFGSPVYWWGVSAQLKMVIDKMYSKGEQFKKQQKKIGLVTVGGDELSASQYRMISEQMECICEYLGWDLIFSYPISAYEKNDLLNNRDELIKLNDLWSKSIV